MSNQKDYYKSYKKYKNKYKALQFGGMKSANDCMFDGCWKCPCGTWNVPLATTCIDCGKPISKAVRFTCKGGVKGCYRADLKASATAKTTQGPATGDGKKKCFIGQGISKAKCSQNKGVWCDGA